MRRQARPEALPVPERKARKSGVQVRYRLFGYGNDYLGTVSITRVRFAVVSVVYGGETVLVPERKARQYSHRINSWGTVEG